MTNNIYLVGFMASGKSTVSRELGRILRRRSLDMDEALSRKFKAPIADVFKNLGEEEFRREETKLLKKLSTQKGLVVATGGGAPILPDNLKLMEDSGVIIHLDVDFETCLKRTSALSREARPKWGDEDSARTLYNQRREYYEKASLTITGGELSAVEVSERIFSELLGETSFSLKMGNETCEVMATGNPTAVLDKIIGNGRRFVLTDKTVGRLHGPKYAPWFQDAVTKAVRPGEQSKTIKTASKIYELMLEGRFDRDDIFIAIGGGVITDLGAFIASTYKRGMEFLLISTTLLGCVDAAIGGKTAVNLGSSKNMIGTFAVPKAVILDLFSLTTLNRRHIREGLVEAYKTGLVVDPGLAEEIEENPELLLKGDQLLMANIAKRSAKAKARIVEKDFKESGIRMLLNFGHTYGHAVESFYRHKVSHGRCVALGMEVAASLSQARGLISKKRFDRISSTLALISPESLEAPSSRDAWQMALQDKKIRKGNVVFVLLKGDTETIIVDDITEDELSEAIERVKLQKNG